MPSTAPPTFHYPELLACSAIVNRMGVPTELIFYGVGVDPNTRKTCVTVVVRAFAGSAEATFAMDEVGDTPGSVVATRLRADIAAWNTLSQEARESHMQASPVRAQAVDIAAVLALKGLTPRQQTPDAKA